MQELDMSLERVFSNKASFTNLASKRICSVHRVGVSSHF